MEKQIIQGYITRYIYYNADNGYSVAVVSTENDERITITGFFPRLSNEVIYEFEGEFIKHPTYGEQLKVSRFGKPKEVTKTGVINYLSSDLFTGIGPKTATEIVELLGVEAIEKIVENHKVLLPVSRMNPIKAKRLQQALINNHEVEKNLIGLYEYGLTGRQAIRLTNHYGASALGVISEDPFILMYEVEGFGFVRALEIAKKIGFNENDLIVQKAAVMYVLNKEAFENSTMYLFKEELIEKISKLLQVEIEYEQIINELLEEEKIVLEEDKIFIKSIYHVEINVANHLMRLNNYELPKINHELEELVNRVSSELDISFTNEQQSAIINAIKNPVSVITGGPGTGKTTIIAGIIKVFQYIKGLSKERLDSGEEIALMAPTGKASKRMSEALRLPSFTIHKHLGYDVFGRFERNQHNPLIQELIIVDEASMIDILLANKLLDAIPSGVRLVIVGDKDQLPSVGPGQVLADIIKSKQINVNYLTQIHRQAEGSQIVDLAFSINNQELKYNDLSSGEEVKFLTGDYKQARQMIKEIVLQAVKSGYSIYEDIQVLIPMYRGVFGIDEINEMMQEMFLSGRANEAYMQYLNLKFYKGDKVIQLVNDHERQVMNGDIGIVSGISLNDDNKKELLVQFDNRIIKYEQAELKELNLAYAVSIHKSQGSEYPICIIPIFKNHFHMLRKELIYTAVTRSKKFLFLIGDNKLLINASSRISEPRRTMLYDRLVNKMAEDAQDDLFDLELNPYDFMD